jgi:hypothetical protein
VAGAFYALAAFVGAGHALEYVRQRPAPVLRMAVCALLLTTSTLWAVRAASVHMMRVQAFSVRNSWGRLPAERYEEAGSDEQRAAAGIVRQLRREALDMRVPNPDLLPRWADRWWGE